MNQNYRIKPEKKNYFIKAMGCKANSDIPLDFTI